MHQFPKFIKVDEIGPYRLLCQDEFDMIIATENLLIMFLIQVKEYFLDRLHVSDDGIIWSFFFSFNFYFILILIFYIFISPCNIFYVKFVFLDLLSTGTF